MEKPLCISYIRFSTASQSDGSSLERQHGLALKYAEDHDLNLDETHSYRDLGKSAYSGDHVKNGHFGLFLELVREGKIPRGTVLLVESLDRLSRENVLDAFAQFQTIISEDIKIVTLCDGMEYTKENLISDFGKLIVSLTIMARANEESFRKSERLLAAFKFKRQNLASEKFTANCPYWMTLSPDKTEFHLVLDRVELIKRIYQMSYNGNGIITIARQFNKEKIPPPRSSIGWYQSTIRKILANPAVIGEFQPKTFNKITRTHDPAGPLIVDYFPRIIEDDLYNAVQNRLNNGTHIAGRTAKIENLFGGITFCGYCNARMDIVSKNNKHEVAKYLVCDIARRGLKCSNISIKCNEVERAFLSYCKEIDIHNILKNEGDREQSNLANLQSQLSAKGGELLIINKQISIIDDDLLAITDHLERDHYKELLRVRIHKKAIVENSIEEIVREITQITSSREDSTTRINSILELMESLTKTESEHDRIQMRTKLRNEIRQIVKKIVVYPRGNVVSDEEIDKVAQKHEKLINGVDVESKEQFIKVRDYEIECMKSTQSNTKDFRYFTVSFKNGNSRHLEYSKADDTYKVSFERTDNAVDWWMGGTKMKTITFESESDQLDAEVEQYKLNHPNKINSPEDESNLRNWLNEQYNNE